MGIRAEDTRPAEDGLPLKVEVVERLGDRTLLYGHLPDGSELIAQDTGRSTAQPGQEIRIAVDPTAVHLFDAEGRAHHAPEAA